MTVLDFMDAVLVNEDISVELYDVDQEETVWNGTYDGFQPRDVIPEEYWDKEVSTFQFDKNFLCINF